jgi:hypothetical protein
MAFTHPRSGRESAGYETLSVRLHPRRRQNHHRRCWPLSSTLGKGSPRVPKSGEADAFRRDEVMIGGGGNEDHDGVDDANGHTPSPSHQAKHSAAGRRTHSHPFLLFLPLDCNDAPGVPSRQFRSLSVMTSLPLFCRHIDPDDSLDRRRARLDLDIRDCTYIG